MGRLLRGSETAPIWRFLPSLACCFTPQPPSVAISQHHTRRPNQKHNEYNNTGFRTVLCLFSLLYHHPAAGTKQHHVYGTVLFRTVFCLKIWIHIHRRVLFRTVRDEAKPCGPLKWTVKRDSRYLVPSVMRLVRTDAAGSSLRRALKITFRGEAGVDEGGILSEVCCCGWWWSWWC